MKICSYFHMFICLYIYHCTAVSLHFRGIAAAEPVTLRMAAVAPEGTSWARDMHAFAREGVFGIDVLFSRRPIKSLGDLDGGRYWVWSLDPIWQATLPALGVKMLATSLDELAPAYQRHDIDGFFAVPSAALAYQWSTLA